MRLNLDLLRHLSTTDPAESALGLNPPATGARDAVFLRLPLPANGTEGRHSRHTPAASWAGFQPLPQRHRSRRLHRLWRVRIILQNPRLEKTQARGITQVDDSAWQEMDGRLSVALLPRAVEKVSNTNANRVPARLHLKGFSLPAHFVLCVVDADYNLVKNIHRVYKCTHIHSRPRPKSDLRGQEILRKDSPRSGRWVRLSCYRRSRWHDSETYSTSSLDINSVPTRCATPTLLSGASRPVLP